MIDLHTHTTASDGIYSPSELIEKAHLEDISIIAVSDHDSVNGLESAERTAEKLGISFITGVELSIEFSGGDLHLLGYNIDYRDEVLVNYLKKISDEREKRIHYMIEDFNKEGYRIVFDEIKEMFPETESYGKPHVARLLIKKGYAKTVDEVFARFFKKGSPGNIKKKKISLERGLQLIKNSGGFPVLAHPASMNLSNKDFENRIGEYIKAGIEGIEVYAGMHSEEEVEFYKQLCLKKDLLITGGSDFHGDKNEKLGYYKMKKIPDTISNQVIERIGKA